MAHENLPEIDGVQTHEDLEAIPEGVQLPDSSGSLIPDVETPEPVTYEEEA